MRRVLTEKVLPHGSIASNTLRSFSILVVSALSIATITLNQYIPHTAAQTVYCESSTFVLIARNGAGNFIPDLNFSVYTQTLDVDGKPKPSKLLGTSKISATLGKGSVTAKPESTEYAVKIWDKNASVGDVWFYNKFIGITCGGSMEETVKVSGIRFTLRDAQQVLRKSAAFSLYTQKNDADGKPIKDKLVSGFNTDTQGHVTTYVADSARAMDGAGPGKYVFEGTGAQGGIFTVPNISVSDGTTTEVTYVFSDIAFTVIDTNSTPYPANTRVEVYKQAYDADGEKIVGTKIRDVLTNDKGVAVFENPLGTYAARVKGSDGLYTNFWDLAMADQQRTAKTLQTGSDFTTSPGACAQQSKVTIITRNGANEIVPGISFELYVQGQDADGKPIATTKATGGKVGTDGTASVLFNPDPTKTYILKLYDKNASKGEFWFFGLIKFKCGEEKEITKKLSSIKVILRDGSGDLLASTGFSLYTQKLDIDGNPVASKQDLVASLVTSNEGFATIYVAPDHAYNKTKKGAYALSIKQGSVEYIQYSINVTAETEKTIDYILSDVVFDVRDARGASLANRALSVYAQKMDAKGAATRATTVTTSAKTNADGIVTVRLAPGTYVAVIKDAVNKDIIFWNIQVSANERRNESLTTSAVELSGRDSTDAMVPEKTPFNVYTLVRDSKDGYYYRGTKLQTINTGQNGYASTVLTEGPYLFTALINKAEYVAATYVQNGKIVTITLLESPDYSAENNKRFKVGGGLQPQTVNQTSSLFERIKGYILLQVESHGEAWYVDPQTRLRYYMKDGPTAYQMMRQLGVGITNENLAKVPIGFDDRIESSLDTDSDGLSDRVENSLGTDPNKKDTDGDGFLDGAEVRNEYSPFGAGRLSIDTRFANGLKGKIYLQVESHGEAWYVNPKNGLRYYLVDGPSAYQIMRFLSMGITNKDIGQVRTGTLK